MRLIKDFTMIRICCKKSGIDITNYCGILGKLNHAFITKLLSILWCEKPQPHPAVSVDADAQFVKVAIAHWELVTESVMCEGGGVAVYFTPAAEKLYLSLYSSGKYIPKLRKELLQKMTDFVNGHCNDGHARNCKNVTKEFSLCNSADPSHQYTTGNFQRSVSTFVAGKCSWESCSS